MFKLNIKLGNEAMRNEEDIASALRNAANAIEYDQEYEGKLRDMNGNTVGEWIYESE